MTKSNPALQKQTKTWTIHQDQVDLFQKCKVGSTFKKSVQFTILIEKKIIMISITEEKIQQNSTDS